LITKLGINEEFTMKYKLILGVWIFLAVVTSGLMGDESPKNLRLLTTDFHGSVGGASRTEGIAPLAVHFSADLNRSTALKQDYHNLNYSWDFGDAGAGNWSNSGRSKDMALGPVAAHIYESPGTYTAALTVRNSAGSVVESASYQIHVIDPDSYYSGLATTCVSDTAHGDFTGAPTGARQVTTDDLSTITQYAGTGRRILFHRGSSWTTSGLDFPDSSGPVTLGAYGSGSGSDELGLYSNAPRITVTSGNFCDLNDKQDWRFMDLRFVDSTRSNGTFGGVFNFQKILFLRLDIDGFSSGIGWSHWNNDSQLMTIDEMFISESHISDVDNNGLYVGGERIVLLGNIVENSSTSHVVRVWQAYKGVISHNRFSGSSTDNSNGRHALKLHGPGYSSFGGVNEYGTPVPSSGLLENLTEFVVVSDNTFGSSGPWPVAIGPQDALTDAELKDILFERNRIIADLGKTSPKAVQVSLNIWAQYVSVRNNIFDGTGGDSSYTSIMVSRRGAEPPPTGIKIFNNTIFRSDNTSGYYRRGIELGSSVTNTQVKNNLISFPGATVPTYSVIDNSSGAEISYNFMTDSAGFIDQGNPSPLLRSFDLTATSPVINKGTDVLVYDDFLGDSRTDSQYDIGAFEY